MPTTTKLKKKTPKPTPVLLYPKLMKHKETGKIFLVLDKTTGIRVYSPEHTTILPVTFLNADNHLEDYIGTIEITTSK